MKKLAMMVVVVGGLAAVGALAGKEEKQTGAGTGPSATASEETGVRDLAAVSTTTEGEYRAKFMAYQGDSTAGAILLLDSAEKPGTLAVHVVCPTDLAKHYEARFPAWTNEHPIVKVGLRPGKPMIVTSIGKSF